MKTLIFILFFLFAVYGCNSIDFSKGSNSSFSYMMQHKLNHSCLKTKDCDPHSQNTPAQIKSLVEHFNISEKKDLEIIFVVDASKSMDDNLTAVGQNMEALLSHVKKGQNWRIAFITADHGDHHDSPNEIADEESWESYHGKIPRFGQFMPLEKNGRVGNQKILTQNTPEHAQVFKDTLTRSHPDECSLPPFCHGYNEQPLRSLKSAIERAGSDPAHQEFFKPHTDTAVIIVTDEDERKHDFVRATRARDVLTAYRNQFRRQNKRLFGFSISIQDEQCLSQENQGGLFQKSSASYGRVIARLAELTGGSNISLCKENYGESLRDISKRAEELVQSISLKKLFYLPSTVQVALIPHKDTAWKLYGRSLVFSKSLPPGTKIKVSYQYEE